MNHQHLVRENLYNLKFLDKTQKVQSIKDILKSGMVVLNCNCSTGRRRLRQKDHKFEASLGYRVRPCLKKKRHIYKLDFI
jgi:hypothetical protein